jgi:hypothetical protein
MRNQPRKFDTRMSLLRCKNRLNTVCECDFPLDRSYQLGTPQKSLILQHNSNHWGTLSGSLNFQDNSIHMYKFNIKTKCEYCKSPLSISMANWMTQGNSNLQGMLSFNMNLQRRSILLDKLHELMTPQCSSCLLDTQCMYFDLRDYRNLSYTI